MRIAHAIPAFLLSTLISLVACEPAADRWSGASTQNFETSDGLRLVALAPHLAELVFAAGAGDFLVGVSSYSDYPDEVLALPLVGDAFVVDQEQLALLKPDMLLAWQSGTPQHVVGELLKRGYRVEVIQTRSLADIASALETIGELTGNTTQARQAAADFIWIVGVSSYSDYPDEVLALPLVGDAFVVDQEQLALLKPDMLLAWQSGTPQHVVGELLKRGYRVEVIQTRSLADIASALETIGELTGNTAQARQAAADFRRGLQALAERYSAAEPIRVFYQVQKRPLYTISGDHYVSELIEHCGGQNIFSDLVRLAPLVAVEAVLDRNPEILLVSSDTRADALNEWDRWPDLAANRYGNRYVMPANEIGRPTPRLLIAGEALCSALQQGRANRDKTHRDE